MPDLSYILKGVEESTIERARNIKAIVCDVDGVLANGAIIYDDDGKEYKVFNVKDGQIIRHLKESGLKVGVITGRESDVVKFRCKELKFDFHHHGIKDKLKVYREELDRYGLKPSEVAYLGDDLVDVSIFKVTGLAICPSDAPGYIKEFAHLVTKSKGGQGVLREAADIILTAQEKMSEIIDKL
ncbi:MAG: HAD-IIIA family hydrolase [Cyclobacteriaceae bacterium]